MAYREANRAKILILQPEIPIYRVPFFKGLQDHFGEELVLFASEGTISLARNRVGRLPCEQHLGPITKIMPGLYWQQGVTGIKLDCASVVVLFGNARFLSNLYLIFRARKEGVKVVWWGHYASATSGRLSRLIRLLIGGLSDALLFYTDKEVSQYLSSRIWKSRSKIVAALNNGIDTREISKLRKPLMSSRPWNILFIGRLTAKCEIEVLLNALCCLDSRVSLYIIGDGERREILQNIVKEYNLEERVFWFGEVTSEFEIANIANRCRLFVYPGSVGLSLIHGLSYGLPSVVHDDASKHMPEVAALKEFKNGRVFGRGNYRQLAEVIESLIFDDELLGRMSTDAITETTESFNVEDMCRRFVSLLERMR